MNYGLLCSVLLIPGSLFASQIGVDTLSCSESRFLKRNCKVAEFDILNTKNTINDLVDVSIDLSFACSSAQDMEVSIASSDGKSKRLNYNDSRVVIKETSGIVRLRNDSPSKTASASVDKSCSLVIKSATVFPANSTINRWKKELSEIDSRVSEAENLLKVYNEALNSRSLVKILDTLTTKFYDDLTTEDLQNLREISTSGSLAIIDFQRNFLGTIRQETCKPTDPKYKEQLIVLNKIQRLLANLDEEDSFKNPDGSLKQPSDFLADSDRAILEKFKEENESDQIDYEARISAINVSIESIKLRGVELKELLDSFGVAYE